MSLKPSELLAEWRALEAKGEVLIQSAEGEGDALLVAGHDFAAIVCFEPLTVTLLEHWEDPPEPQPVTRFVLDRFGR